MCHTELLFKKLKLSQDVVDCCAKKLMNKKYLDYKHVFLHTFYGFVIFMKEQGKQKHCLMSTGKHLNKPFFLTIYIKI